MEVGPFLLHDYGGRAQCFSVINRMSQRKGNKFPQLTLLAFSFPVWGRCSHVFHMHCILKWLNSQLHQQLCPMCRQEWQFKE